MTNNVMPFTRAKPTADVLDAAAKEDFETILIVGVRRDGRGWVSMGNMSNAETIWNIELAKKAILDA